MSTTHDRNPERQKVILDGVIKILRDMNGNWEAGFDAYSGNVIGPVTRLSADLDFTSIKMAQLAVAIENYFGARELPFFELFNSQERDTDDISVSDLVGFLVVHLAE